MSKTKKRKRNNENESVIKTIVKKSATGTAVGIATFFAMMLLFAVVTVKAQLSSSIQNVLPFISVALSCILGAYLTGRLAKKKGIMYGAITSLAEDLIICIVLFFVNRELGIRTLIMTAISLISGMAGGVMAVNKKVKRK